MSSIWNFLLSNDFVHFLKCSLRALSYVYCKNSSLPNDFVYFSCLNEKITKVFADKHLRPGQLFFSNHFKNLNLTLCQTIKEYYEYIFSKFINVIALEFFVIERFRIFLEMFVSNFFICSSQKTFKFNSDNQFSQNR